jgi:putative ABC transport system permease protein
VMLLLLSFAVGIPLSYLFGLQWLSNFAYRIELAWWIFTAPVAFVFFVTLLVVVAQSLKTAVSNPVKSLRYE